jgi:ATP-dependent Clp protease protease subunit
MGGAGGQASQVDIQAREILRIREVLNGILVQHTGKNLDTIEQDTDRDFFMAAEEAKEYGIIDSVIVKKPVGPPPSDGE